MRCIYRDWSRDPPLVQVTVLVGVVVAVALAPNSNPRHTTPKKHKLNIYIQYVIFLLISVHK